MNTNVTEVNLRGNHMGSAGMGALSQALTDNVYITHLVRPITFIPLTFTQKQISFG